MGPQNKSDQRTYLNAIGAFRLEECYWMRLSRGAKANFLYHLQDLDDDWGWHCGADFSLKYRVRGKAMSDTHRVLVVMVKRDSSWVFVGARALSMRNTLGCSWMNFLGATGAAFEVGDLDIVPGNHHRWCFEEPSEPWPPQGL